jgi:hypothetical protein
VFGGFACHWSEASGVVMDLRKPRNLHPSYTEPNGLAVSQLVVRLRLHFDSQTHNMSAPILPFRIKSNYVQQAWTGARVTTEDVDHGLVRIEDDRIVIQVTRSRKVTTMSALGSTDSAYENLPVEEHVIMFDDMVLVTLRVPTWRFWESPRVVFQVRELRALQGLHSTGPAEFSVPVDGRDRVIANIFVVQCNLAMSDSPPPIPAGNANAIS